MRTSVIKKAVMTASLGLALFFSGQAVAQAYCGLVYGTCAVDSNDRLRVRKLRTSPEPTFPSSVVEGGFCMEALEDLEAAGCTQSPLLEPGPVICDRGELFQNPIANDGSGPCGGDSGSPAFVFRMTCGPCS